MFGVYILVVYVCLCIAQMPIYHSSPSVGAEGHLSAVQTAFQPPVCKQKQCNILTFSIHTAIVMCRVTQYSRSYIIHQLSGISLYVDWHLSIINNTLCSDNTNLSVWCVWHPCVPQTTLCASVYYNNCCVSANTRTVWEWVRDSPPAVSPSRLLSTCWLSGNL